jgi:hypothetical protein
LTRHQKLVHQLEPAKRRKLQHDGQSLDDIIRAQAHPQHDSAFEDGQNTTEWYSGLQLADDLSRPQAIDHHYHQVSNNPDLAANATNRPREPLETVAAHSWQAHHQRSPVRAGEDLLTGQESQPRDGSDVRPAIEEKQAQQPLQSGASIRDSILLTSGSTPFALISTGPQSRGSAEFPSFNDSDFFTDHLTFNTTGNLNDLGPNAEFNFPTPVPAIAASVGGLSASAPSEKHIDEDLRGLTDANVFSRIGSPLPSSRNNENNLSPRGSDQQAVSASGPCWKVSQADYIVIQAEVGQNANILPSNFTLPSRHTMSHCLERCINSFYKHQPFLHKATFRPRDATLELILAMCTVGSQLRFEPSAGLSFFNAAKSLILARQRPCTPVSIDGSNRLMMPNDAASSNQSPGGPHAIAASPQDGAVLTRCFTDEAYRWQTIQALLTLMCFGSWGPKHLLGETMMLQGLLVGLVRTEALIEHEMTEDDDSWPLHDRWAAWVEAERRRRVRNIAYCFTSLQSLAFNTVPPISTAELQCLTPSSAREWAAPTAQRWLEARVSSGIVHVPFQDAFTALFLRNPVKIGAAEVSMSPLGLYALIFGILQCIYQLRQPHPLRISSEVNGDTRLGSGEIDHLVQALRKWESWWKICPESTIEAEGSMGPISFNAIACLRMAWIRISLDLGPCRHLATRNEALIASVFDTGPPLERSPGLTPPLLQAIHALSVPVRLGIKFVSRSQTMFWSVNQSLCTLECAVIISKWFEALHSTLDSAHLTHQEKNMLHILRDIVLESGAFSDDELAALSPFEEIKSDFVFKPQNAGDLPRNMYRSPSGDPFGELAHFINPLEWTLPEESPLPNTPPAAAAMEADVEKWKRQIECLSITVARLWAEIFQNPHVFDLVTTIGKTLNVHPKVRKPLGTISQ